MDSRPLLHRVFISAKEPRLRAGWRLLLQVILLSLMGMLSTMPFLSLVGSERLAPGIRMLAGELGSVISITLSVFVARRWLDRRSITSLGLKLNIQALLDMFAGIFFTGIMFAAIYAIEYGLGWLKFDNFAWQQQAPGRVAFAMAAYAAVFVIVGWQEELLSRGYQLQNLADGLGSRGWAAMLSSLIFAALHMNNPNFSWGALLGLVFCGLALAYPYLRSNQLWLSIGIHIGWNFFEGPVFGFAVSGMATPRLLLHQIIGPEWITGGGFGPEGGLILIPGLLALTALVYSYTRGRRQ